MCDKPHRMYLCDRVCLMWRSDLYRMYLCVRVCVFNAEI